MAVQRDYSKIRPDWTYMNALSEARNKLLDGANSNEAVAHALSKHELPEEDERRLMEHIREKGARLF